MLLLNGLHGCRALRLESLELLSKAEVDPSQGKPEKRLT